MSHFHNASLSTFYYNLIIIDTLNVTKVLKLFINNNILTIRFPLLYIWRCFLSSLDCLNCDRLTLRSVKNCHMLYFHRCNCCMHQYKKWIIIFFYKIKIKFDTLLTLFNKSMYDCNNFFNNKNMWNKNDFFYLIAWITYSNKCYFQ